MDERTAHNERSLDTQNMGWVRVSMQRDGVSISGSGSQVGLRWCEAVRLLRYLYQYEAFIRDRASSYYDCRECGDQHHHLVKVCPTLVQSGD